MKKIIIWIVIIIAVVTTGFQGWKGYNMYSEQCEEAQSTKNRLLGVESNNIDSYRANIEQNRRAVEQSRSVKMDSLLPKIKIGQPITLVGTIITNMKCNVSTSNSEYGKFTIVTFPVTKRRSVIITFLNDKVYTIQDINI